MSVAAGGGRSLGEQLRGTGAHARIAPARAAAIPKRPVQPTACRAPALFPWPVLLLLVAEAEVEVDGEVADEGAALELLREADPDAEVDDVNGSEKVVEGRAVGKEREVLEEACAQNCWAMDSADARSLEHCAAVMHATRPEVNFEGLHEGDTVRGAS